MNSSDDSDKIYHNPAGIIEALTELKSTIIDSDILTIPTDSHSKLVSDLKEKRRLIHSIVKLFETTVERTRGYLIIVGSNNGTQKNKRDVEAIALRLGYIKKEDQWISLVGERNQTAHQYPLEIIKMEKIVKEVKTHVPTLEEIVKNL